MLELHFDHGKYLHLEMYLETLSFFWLKTSHVHGIPIVDSLTLFLLLTLQDKPSLFKSFFKWLKPGGKVLISDYCKSPGKPSEEFAAYIKQRGYDLHDVEAYGQVVLRSYLILFLFAWLMLNTIALI